MTPIPVLRWDGKKYMLIAFTPENDAIVVDMDGSFHVMDLIELRLGAIPADWPVWSELLRELAPAG